MITDRLEERLGRIALQLDGPGEHVDDERIALIGAGTAPTEAEAAHLSGCDDCLDLLVALGEGLDALAVDEPLLGALMATTPPAPRTPPRRWPTVALLLVAGAAAAAGYMLADGSRSIPDRPEPAGPPVEAPVGIEPVDEAENTAPRAGAVDLTVVLDRLGGVATEGLDRALPTLPPMPAPTASTVAPDLAVAPGATRAPDPIRKPATRPAPAGSGRAAPTSIGRLSRRDGPRPLNRQPVDGPPKGYGYLQLNTKPSARVFVDDKPHGWTPIIDLRLPEGPHDVRLVFDSDLAAEPTQRFRVLIEPDRTWRMTRDNVRRTSADRDP